MKIKKIFTLAIFIFFILFGCAMDLYQNGRGAPRENAEVKEFNPLKTVFVWNDENVPVFFTLKRNYEVKEWKISPQNFLKLNLKKGGDYFFYYYALNSEFNMFAEKEGRFEISPNNKIQEYRSEFAARHIKIENLRWKNNRIKKVFSVNGIPGEIKYGKNEDQIIFETPAGNIRGEISGGPALIFRKITKKNKGGE